MLSRPQQGLLTPVPDERMLSAKQVGAEFGVSEDAVLAWWHNGLPQNCGDIPEKFVRRRGFKDYLFHPAVLDYIRQKRSELC
jgi:hypothetical protein